LAGELLISLLLFTLLLVICHLCPILTSVSFFHIVFSPDIFKLSHAPARLLMAKAAKQWVCRTATASECRATRQTKQPPKL
jgi:hypothetical protein